MTGNTHILIQKQRNAGFITVLPQAILLIPVFELQQNEVPYCLSLFRYVLGWHHDRVLSPVISTDDVFFFDNDNDPNIPFGKPS